MELYEAKYMHQRYQYFLILLKSFKYNFVPYLSMLARQSVIIIIILLCELIVSESPQEFEQYTLVSKFYHNVERQFFVMIGAQQNFTSAINSQLRSWSGLNIISNEDDFNNFMYHGKSQNLKFSISNNSLSESNKLVGQSRPATTLKQLCQSYYLIRPSLMILSEPTNQYNILSTNEWSNQLCSPQMIFVVKNKNQSDTNLESYLLGKNYQQISFTSRFIAYVKRNQFYVADNRAVAYEKTKAFIHISNQERDVIAIYRMLFPSQPFSHGQIHNPTKIYIEQMTDNLLAIPNILRQLTFIGQKRPIFVLNFRIEEDIILLGTQAFSIVQLKVEHMTFKNITLSFEDNVVYNVFVLINRNNDDSWLKLIDENGEVVFERASGKVKNSDIVKECVDVQEKVIVKVRDGFYSFQPLKATVRQEIKYPKPQKVVTNEKKEVTKLEEKTFPPTQAKKQETPKQTESGENKIQRKPESPQVIPQVNPQPSNIQPAPQSAEMAQWTIFFWAIIACFTIICLLLLFKNQIRKKNLVKNQNISKAFSYFTERIESFEMEEIQQSEMPDETIVQSEQIVR